MQTVHCVGVYNPLRLGKATPVWSSDTLKLKEEERGLKCCNLPLSAKVNIFKGAGIGAGVSILRNMESEIKHSFGGESIIFHKLDGGTGAASQGYRYHCREHHFDLKVPLVSSRYECWK